MKQATCQKQNNDFTQGKAYTPGQTKQHSGSHGTQARVQFEGHSWGEERNRRSCPNSWISRLSVKLVPAACGKSAHGSRLSAGNEALWWDALLDHLSMYTGWSLHGKGEFKELPKPMLKQSRWQKTGAVLFLLSAQNTGRDGLCCGDRGSRPGQHTCSLPLLWMSHPPVSRKQTFRKIWALVPVGQLQWIFSYGVFHK